MSPQILIVGAGAAGLLAARRLSASGFNVHLIEAAEFAGGRIRTVSISGFPAPVEAGAEFVHGDLPVTVALAREAGVSLVNTHFEQMAVGSQAAGPSYWDEMMEKMGRLDKDVAVADFLSTYFGGEKYEMLRRSVRGFAEGYDLADLNSASTKALYAEWSSEEGTPGYRPEGGYGRLVDFLVRQCDRLGVAMHFSTPVTEIHWQEGSVDLVTGGGSNYEGAAVLVTVSLGALFRLAFKPAIPDYLQAARRIGYGSVVKILLNFRSAFWRKKKGDETTLFVLSDQPVPTWWTQTGATSTLLTGWLTGENMRRFLRLDEKGQVDACLASLERIFSLGTGDLRNELMACYIIDWGQQPNVYGGYSFETVTTPESRRVLNTPVGDTVYFAGEAVDEGQAPGTVEAAFHSGLVAAEKIIARHQPRY